MHMLMVIVGGIVLLGVFLLFGKLWGGEEAALGLAAKTFIPVWLAIAVANLWIGVSHAGYTVREELPILLIVFLVPTVLAGLVIWKQA
jgi:NAD/NADP transhydrogenase beta subunit